jgi:hypothetical protein
LRWAGPPEFVIENIGKLMDCLLGSIEGLFHGFVKGRSGESAFIPLSLKKSLFECLIMIVDKVQSGIEGVVDSIESRLNTELSGDDVSKRKEKRISQSMVIHLLAKIAYYIPDQPEFISTVFGWIAEAWKQAAEEVTFYNLAIAFMCVFSVGSEQLEGQRDERMTGLVALLRREDVNDRNLNVACAALWATFITVYQMHGAPEWVKEILAALQLSSSMEVLPWVADFMVFAHGNWPDVVAPKWPSFVSTILSSG